MKYRVIIEQDEDGMYVAECPSLQGCISQGKSRKEALKNIRDAIRGYLESLKKHNEPIPSSIHEEFVDVTLEKNPKFRAMLRRAAEKKGGMSLESYRRSRKV